MIDLLSKLRNTDVSSAQNVVFPFSERENIHRMVFAIDYSLEGWRESIDLIQKFYRENHVYGKIVLYDFFSKEKDRNIVPLIEGVYEFNKDCLDFFGRPKGAEAEAFKKKEFDALVAVGNKPSTALQILISESNSHFKVGRSGLGYNFDMTVDPPSEVGFTQVDSARWCINLLFSMKWK